MPEFINIYLSVDEDSRFFFGSPADVYGAAGVISVLDTSLSQADVQIYDNGFFNYRASTAFDALKVGETAQDSFDVTFVSDGVTTHYRYIVEVIGKNEAPKGSTELPVTYGRVGQFWEYTFDPGVISDSNGDPLTYSMRIKNGDPLPEWLTFNAETLTVSGTIPADQLEASLNYSFILEASDGLASAQAGLELYATKPPYVNTMPPDVVSIEEEFISIQLPLDLFDQADGEAFTVTATRRNGTPLPEWLTFDPETMTISGQPPLDYRGDFFVAVTASTTEPVSQVFFNVQIQDVDDAPLAAELSTPWVTELSPFETIVGVLSAEDPDPNEVITYRLLDDAGGLFSIDGNMLMVSGHLDARKNGGVQTIVVEATDLTGLTSQTSIAVEVRKQSDGNMFDDIEPTKYLWVSPDGDDMLADGSAENPYATIQLAIDNATPGTAIMVKSGTYVENLTLNHGGTPDAPIWLISADGKGAAEIKPVAEPETSAITGNSHADNWVIEGFAITGSDTIGTYGFNFNGSFNGVSATINPRFAPDLVTNIVIRDNIVTDWGIDGIKLSYVFNAEITGNTVIGAHEQGIDVVNGSKIVIATNYVAGITKKTEWFGLDQRDYVGDAGISVKGGSIDIQIINNTVLETAGYGIKVGGPTNLNFVPIVTGLDGDGAHYSAFEAKNVLVLGNTIRHSSNGSLDLNAAQDVLVQENLLSTIRVGGYTRTLTSATIDEAEYLLPNGVALTSNDIRLVDNVTTANSIINNPPGVIIQQEGTVRFDSNAVYDVEDYAWVAGTSASWASSRSEIMGNGNANTLVGTSGADVIDGKLNADVMSGGAGDDYYMFDNVGDQAHELADGGIDTIVLTRGFTRYVMPDPDLDPNGYIENLVLADNRTVALVGNRLDNSITSNDGHDSIKAMEGDDAVFARGGNDSVEGGAGNDQLFGGDGNDRLQGGADNDTLDGGAGLDVLVGGEGDDLLISMNTDQRITGGVGIDTLYLDRSTFTAEQRIVLDIGFFGNGTAGSKDERFSTLIDGTRIENVEIVNISAGAGDDYIIGGAFDDEIAGGFGDDLLIGGGGIDRIWGGAGQDIVLGGDGNDILDGGLGGDWVDGGAGDDRVESRLPDFRLLGGEGIDTINLDRGELTEALIFDGQAIENAPDQLFTLVDGTQIGGFETFIIRSGSGNDVLIGGSRNDRLQGVNGDDVLIGGSGSDTLSGGSGVDMLYGGTGSDRLIGSGGADHLWGEQGTDTFYMERGQAQGDTIYDFEGAGIAGGDKLEFAKYGEGASLVYDETLTLWNIVDAQGNVIESFTIVGVTHLAASDYTLT